MPGRNSSADEATYRYAYNGMEADGATKGERNSYTTEFRQYDPRLGRWLSLDPKMRKYPSESPYAAFHNNPIFWIDPLGDDPPRKRTKKYIKAIKHAAQVLFTTEFLMLSCDDGICEAWNMNTNMFESTNITGVDGNIFAAMKVNYSNDNTSSAAVRDVIENPKKYDLECALFVQFCIAYAELESLGDKKFNKKYNSDNPLIISQIDVTSISVDVFYFRESPDETFQLNGSESMGNSFSIGRVLQDNPIGTRIALTNLDKDVNDSFRNENIIKTGVDEDGNDLYAAKGIGLDMTLAEVRTAMAKMTYNEDEDGDFDIYAKKTIFVSQVEIKNQK